MKTQNVLLRVSIWIFISCGIWLIGLGGYFMFVRPPLLPEDLRYLGSNAVQVDVLLPHLAAWLRHVFRVMGGFIAGCGLLVVFVSVRVVPQHLRDTGAVFCCVGLLSVATMSWTNFALNSDFKWLLLVPPVIWLLGLATYAAHYLMEPTVIAAARANADALP